VKPLILISIQDLLDQLAEVTQSAIKTMDALPYPHAEMDQLGANIGKARNILHWQPQRSLRKMLEDEWLFYQNMLRGQ
jgi:UDP-glucose 4-epimerase